eukprot:scaffold1456_cov392-Prasinococcus_capsulatus_cf.AAC.3
MSHDMSDDRAWTAPKPPCAGPMPELRRGVAAQKGNASRGLPGRSPMPGSDENWCFHQDMKASSEKRGV